MTEHNYKFRLEGFVDGAWEGFSLCWDERTAHALAQAAERVTLGLKVRVVHIDSPKVSLDPRPFMQTSGYLHHLPDIRDHLGAH